MRTGLNLIVGVVVTVLAVAGAATANADALLDEVSRTSVVMNSERAAFAPATAHVDTLDQLRELGREAYAAPLLRYPDVYDFSSQLDDLRGLSVETVPDAHAFITHLDELRRMGPPAYSPERVNE